MVHCDYPDTCCSERAADAACPRAGIQGTGSLPVGQRRLWFRPDRRRGRLREKGKAADRYCLTQAAVHTDADDFITGFAQVGIIIPQVAGLCRAAGCHVFGVEVKYNLLSLIVAQADFYTFFVDTQYFGCFISYIHFVNV